VKPGDLRMVRSTPQGAVAPWGYPYDNPGPVDWEYFWQTSYHGRFMRLGTSAVLVLSQVYLARGLARGLDAEVSEFVLVLCGEQRMVVLSSFLEEL
jgi:hypothetical protein